MKWILASSFVVFAFSLILFSRTGEGIKCYVCNSFNDSIGCTLSTVSETYLQDCSEQKEGQKATMCRKIRQWVDFDLLSMKANERVFRTCGYEKTERDCYYRAGFGGRQDVCTCYEDKCNGALRAIMNWPTLIGIVLASFIGVQHIV